MEKSFGNSDPKIGEYVVEVFKPEDKVLSEIRERTEKEDIPLIQVGPMDGRHLEVLTRAAGAKKAVEIGTLTGYSGISILRGLGAGGRLFTFEIDNHIADVARDSFKKAGFETSVELFLGPASDNLPKIEKHGPFDLVFLDADKTGYLRYFQWAKKNLKVGGIVLADNTFGFGKIAEENLSGDPDEESVKALRAYNLMVSDDPQFKSTIFPTEQGLTMSVKIA